MSLLYDFRTGGADATVGASMFASSSICDEDRRVTCPLEENKKDASVMFQGVRLDVYDIKRPLENCRC